MTDPPGLKEIATVGMEDISLKTHLAALVKNLQNIVQLGEQTYRRLPEELKQEIEQRQVDITASRFDGLGSIVVAVATLPVTPRFLLIDSLNQIYLYLAEENSIALTENEMKICEGIFVLLQRLGDNSQKALRAGLQGIVNGSDGEKNYLLITVDGKKSEVRRHLSIPPELKQWFE